MEDGAGNICKEVILILFGIFDGHSGDYISKRLPKLFKTILLKQIEQVVEMTKQK